MNADDIDPVAIKTVTCFLVVVFVAIALVMIAGGLLGIGPYM